MLMCVVDSDAGTRVNLLLYINILIDISVGNYKQKPQKDNFKVKQEPTAYILK